MKKAQRLAKDDKLSTGREETQHICTKLDFLLKKKETWKGLLLH